MLTVIPKTVIKAMNLLLALDNIDLEMNILDPPEKRRMSIGNEMESLDSILDSVSNFKAKRNHSVMNEGFKGIQMDVELIK